MMELVSIEPVENAGRYRFRAAFREPDVCVEVSADDLYGYARFQRVVLGRTGRWYACPGDWLGQAPAGRRRRYRWILRHARDGTLAGM